MCLVARMLEFGPTPQRSVRLTQPSPDLAVTAEDQVAEADGVATRWSASGTQLGSFAGAAPSGRCITVTGMHFHRVARGRLVEHWELNQLGALRPISVLG